MNCPACEYDDPYHFEHAPDCERNPLRPCERARCEHPLANHDDREGCRVMLTRYGFFAPAEGRLEQCDCTAYQGSEEVAA